MESHRFRTKVPKKVSMRKGTMRMAAATMTIMRLRDVELRISHCTR